MPASPRASARPFRITPPVFYGDLDRALKAAIPDPLERTALRDLLWELIEWQRLSAGVLNSALQGKLNNGGTVTLTASSATTTFAEVRIGTDTTVFLWPITANAAAEVGAGGLFQTHPNVTKGVAILNHASNAQVDRTFRFSLIG